MYSQQSSSSFVAPAAAPDQPRQQQAPRRLTWGRSRNANTIVRNASTDVPVASSSIAIHETSHAPPGGACDQDAAPAAAPAAPAAKATAAVPNRGDGREEQARRAALRAVLARVLDEDGARLDHCTLTVQVGR
jgi:hypothetical protein